MNAGTKKGNAFVKISKNVSIALLVLSLCFASAVFTVVVYAKLIEQENEFQNGNDVHNVQMDEFNRDDELLYEAWVPEASVEAPLILQYPELPRGGEIASLTMMLQHAGVEIDKLTLAEKMPTDETPIQYGANGIRFWGDPNHGFVGDVTLDSPGFGMYHKPLHELAAAYLDGAVDLTGESFKRLELQVAKGIPVIVWTTSSYDEPKMWVEWDSPDGKIRTTHEKHAVLLVGYDETYVYLNDPLKNTKPIKVSKKQFVYSWELMGKQAITYEESEV